MGSPFSWTGTELVLAVRNTIGDPEAQSTRWSNEEIVGYLNRAGQQLVLDGEILLQSQWTTTLTVDVSEYKMPVNFVQDRIVQYEKATDDIFKLRRLTTEDYQDTLSRDPTASGEPQSYYFWRKLGEDLTTYQPTSIFIIPTPNSAAATKTIRVWGYKIPDAIDADALDKVSEFQATQCEALVLYAASLAMMDDKEGAMADKLMARYEHQVTKIKNVVAKTSRAERPRLIPRRSTLTAPILPWKGRML